MVVRRGMLSDRLTSADRWELIFVSTLSTQRLKKSEVLSFTHFFSSLPMNHLLFPTNGVFLCRLVQMFPTRFLISIPPLSRIVSRETLKCVPTSFLCVIQKSSVSRLDYIRTLRNTDTGKGKRTTHLPRPEVILFSSGYVSSRLVSYFSLSTPSPSYLYKLKD